MKTNWINLKRMYNHVLLNVLEENIEMAYFRRGNIISHECKSFGCVIGHCLILDNWNDIPFRYGEIDFTLWSRNFTGIKPYSENWDWCFGNEWSDNKEQVLLRLKYFIDNQSTPEDWDVYSYNYLLSVTELKPYEFN